MPDIEGQSPSGSGGTGDNGETLVWSVKETARKLGRSQMAIYHLIRRGHIPAHKAGGRWVFVPDEIRAWLTNKKGATRACG